MIIDKFVVGAVMTNCYVVSDDQTKDALIIDPGAEAKKIAALIREKELKVRAVLLTHGHFDHILAAGELCGEFQAKLYCLEEEKELMMDPVMNVGRMFHFECTAVPDDVFRAGDRLEFGSLACTVIPTPGHTRGGVCFYFENEGILFSGDTLFFESVGRTDMPTGNAAVLIQSIKEKLFVLPEETKVYPGHGPATTIGYEKNNNPYMDEEGYMY